MRYGFASGFQCWMIVTGAAVVAGTGHRLPSLLNMAVATPYPVPSRVEVVQAMRIASDAANAAGSKLLAGYYEDHPELAVGDAPLPLARGADA